MPLTWNLRNRKFNLRIRDQGAGGEFNLPGHIIDLSSIIGVAISCLATGSEFATVLPKLDFYARFFRCFTYESPGKQGLVTNFTIGTVCVAFDGSNKPFWFGSTLPSSSDPTEIENKLEDMYTRQGVLVSALAKYKPELRLPLMPPTHQMSIGTHIKSFIFGENPKHVADNDVAEPIVKLLQLITQPREVVDLSVHRSWEIVPDEPPGFTALVDEVRAKTNAHSKELNFGKFKDFVHSHSHFKQQYGNCSETYPLLFILQFVPPLFLVFSSEAVDGGISLILLRWRSLTAPQGPPALDFQGLARSLGNEEPAFYTGIGVECGSSVKCKMKCKNGFACTGYCKCPQHKNVPVVCKRGPECTTVCRQGKDCETRCCGGVKCKTVGPFALCRGRLKRCKKHRGSLKTDCLVEDPCWHHVCERCMLSGTCCNLCSEDGTCVKCDDFMPLCENCQALILSTDALGFKNWNKSLHQNWKVNPYMM